MRGTEALHPVKESGSPKLSRSVSSGPTPRLLAIRKLGFRMSSQEGSTIRVERRLGMFPYDDDTEFGCSTPNCSFRYYSIYASSDRHSLVSGTSSSAPSQERPAILRLLVWPISDARRGRLDHMERAMKWRPLFAHRTCRSFSARPLNE